MNTSEWPLDPERVLDVLPPYIRKALAYLDATQEDFSLVSYCLEGMPYGSRCALLACGATTEENGTFALTDLGSQVVALAAERYPPDEFEIDLESLKVRLQEYGISFQ